MHLKQTTTIISLVLILGSLNACVKRERVLSVDEGIVIIHQAQIACDMQYEDVRKISATDYELCVEEGILSSLKGYPKEYSDIFSKMYDDIEVYSKKFDQKKISKTQLIKKKAAIVNLAVDKVTLKNKALLQSNSENQAASAALGNAMGSWMTQQSNAASQRALNAQQNSYNYYQAPNSYNPPSAPTNTNCTVTGGNMFFPQQQVKCRTY